MPSCAPQMDALVPIDGSVSLVELTMAFQEATEALCEGVSPVATGTSDHVKALDRVFEDLTKQVFKPILAHVPQLFSIKQRFEALRRLQTQSLAHSIQRDLREKALQGQQTALALEGAIRDLHIHANLEGQYVWQRRPVGLTTGTDWTCAPTSQTMTARWCDLYHQLTERLHPDVVKF